MKTYEQLMKHYWGVIVPMAEAAGIDPWECVRHLTGIFGSDKVFHKQEFTDHPDFKLPEDKSGYTFALTVLEKRPVFIGDKLWHKENEIWTTILFEHCLKRNIDKYTWTPPTKKRTFMLGGVELPCPISVDNERQMTDNRLEFSVFKNGKRFSDAYFRFEHENDVEKVERVIFHALFEAARDKE